MSQRGWQRYECIVLSAGTVFSFLSISPSLLCSLTRRSCCLSVQEKLRVKQWAVSRPASQLVRRRRKWLSVSGNNRKSLQLQLWFFKAPPSLCLHSPGFGDIVVPCFALNTSRIDLKCWKWSILFTLNLLQSQGRASVESLYEFSWKRSRDERKREGK